MNKTLRHALIVEDSAFLMKMMQKVLSSHNIRVSSARNGQEAIKIIETDPPHILLLDILLPHTDGFIVLQYRKEKQLSFPVIVCSNLSDKATKDRCVALNVTEYIVKSDMDDAQLLPLVEKYLQ